MVGTNPFPKYWLEGRHLVVFMLLLLGWWFAVDTTPFLLWVSKVHVMHVFWSWQTIITWCVCVCLQFYLSFCNFYTLPDDVPSGLKHVLVVYCYVINIQLMSVVTQWSTDLGHIFVGTELGLN
jgi:hypothetical protein